MNLSCEFEGLGPGVYPGGYVDTRGSGRYAYAFAMSVCVVLIIQYRIPRDADVQCDA
jgi:hypothetical protein